MATYLGDGLWDMSDGPADPGSATLTEVLERWDVVEIHGGMNPYILATDKGEVEKALDEATLDRDMATAEMGTSSPSPWTNWLREEHVAGLRGERGLKKFMEMKRGDGTIRGSLRLFKTPIVGARWYVEPGSDSQRDQNIAKRFEQMIYADMSHGWNEVINEILLMVDYGHSIFEKVFIEYDDGFLGWRKLAPRHPMDVQEWVWDANGGPAGVRMKSERNADGIFIPISKLLIFPMDVEGGDLRGTSVLRSAYKHWFYKESLYKIDAIQKERHGIGVPVIKLPPGFSPADKALADDLGRNLRTNERAHVVLPSNWEIIFAKLEGQPVDALRSIEHHDATISKNILAPFMHDNMDDSKQSLFMKSTRYVANTIAEVVNMYGFRQLIEMNYIRKPGEPKLRARRIGEWDDLRTLSFALRNLIGAGVIRPDDRLEAAMRQEYDLPIADPNTAREVVAPQGDPEGGRAAPVAPRAGMPRQNPAGTMGIGQVGPGSTGRTGLDRSGG